MHELLGVRDIRILVYDTTNVSYRSNLRGVSIHVLLSVWDTRILEYDTTNVSYRSILRLRLPIGIVLLIGIFLLLGIVLLLLIVFTEELLLVFLELVLGSVLCLNTDEHRVH